MKWALTHQSADNHKWILQDATEAQLTYNRQHQSIRIRSNVNRLFFLETAGNFFHKKIVLRTEYGVVIGESPWMQTLKEGALLLNDEKHFFKWSDKCLSLFDKNRALLSSVTIEAFTGLEKTEQYALIFSHAWVASAKTSSSKEKDLLVA